MVSIDVLVAVHPVRRIVDRLALDGPAQVGTLARELGEQVGSISHHLRVLERVEVVGRAPELSTDGRTSWWRAASTSLSWAVDDFADRPADRHRAQVAENLTFERQARKVAVWKRLEQSFPEAWRRAAYSTDSLASVRWRPRCEAWAAYVWLAAQGVAIVVLGLGPQWLTVLAAALIGVTAGVASVLLSAVSQALIDQAYLGRMASVQRMGDDVLMPLATVGFGALAAASGSAVAFAAYGGAMTLAMAVPLANPAMRRISLRGRAQPTLAAARRAS